MKSKYRMSYLDKAPQWQMNVHRLSRKGPQDEN